MTSKIIGKMSNNYFYEVYFLRSSSPCSMINYYSYGEHCWVFFINFNTKWRASNTFEAHSGGPQMYLRPATGKHGHLHCVLLLQCYKIVQIKHFSIPRSFLQLNSSGKYNQTYTTARLESYLFTYATTNIVQEIIKQTSRPIQVQIS